MKIKSIFSLILTALAALSVSAPASAAIVLEIEVTGPTTAQLRATGQPSLIDDNSATALNGVSLIGLFETDFFAVIAPITSGDLSPSGGPVLSNLFTNLFELTDRDINLFRISDTTPIQFSTSASAFTGSLDVEFVTSAPTQGTVGDVIVGDGQSGSGAVIGQFRVIPEPTSVALLGVAGLLVTRRRRAR